MSWNCWQICNSSSIVRCWRKAEATNDREPSALSWGVDWQVLSKNLRSIQVLGCSNKHEYCGYVYRMHNAAILVAATFRCCYFIQPWWCHLDIAYPALAGHAFCLYWRTVTLGEGYHKGIISLGEHSVTILLVLIAWGFRYRPSLGMTSRDYICKEHLC